MIGVADQNGRTYKSKYGTYNKQDGFNITNYGISNDVEDLIYNLFHEDLWSLKVEEKEMTKEEIEEALGYKIKIKENSNNYSPYNELNFADIFSFLHR